MAFGFAGAAAGAQDAIFQHRFGGYVDQYGPQGAASMWFSGDPTPDGDKDQLGTSDSDYVAKFMAGLGGGGGMGQHLRRGLGIVRGHVAHVVTDQVPRLSHGHHLVTSALHLERGPPTHRRAVVPTLNGS